MVAAQIRKKKSILDTLFCVICVDEFALFKNVVYY